MSTESEPARRGVALLVDGENLPAKFAEELVTIVRTNGELLVARAYGNVQRLTGWDAAPDFQVIHTGPANKNSADMLLTLVAADLAWLGKFRTFVLGTSDHDYIHLARYLRARLGRGRRGPSEYVRTLPPSLHPL